MKATVDAALRELEASGEAQKLFFKWQGMTLVCVTHEMGFAREVADRILFMADGSILERASAENFFAHPEHPRTRKFLSDIRSPFGRY